MLNKILLNKIREKIKVYTSDRQLGFRPNRGIVDVIFIVRQLLQKAKERGRKCHYHFADLKSAFDTTWRKALWKIMRSIGMKKKIVHIVEKMHAKTTCDVVVDGLLTERFSVSVSFREGCLLSPTLFNLFLDVVMDEIKMFTNRVTLDENLNFEARYADDTTLIAAVFERLQLSTDQLQKACKKYGMKISTKKCKIISYSTTNLTIEDEEIEIMKEFENLEAM